MIGIYKIENPIGQIYIGQSTNVHKRIKDHKHKINKLTTPLCKSFEIFGYDNHKMTIIEECDIELLNDRERYWQDFYDVLNKNGLNSVLTKCTNKKSKKRPELVIILTAMAIGRKTSDTAKEKQRNAKIGKKLPESHRKNISIAHTGSKKGQDWAKYTPILNTETGIYYDTLKEAAFSINIPYQTLWCIINSKRQYRSAKRVPMIRA